jgi:hypothetical protein
MFIGSPSIRLLPVASRGTGGRLDPRCASSTLRPASSGTTVAMPPVVRKPWRRARSRNQSYGFQGCTWPDREAGC